MNLITKLFLLSMGLGMLSFLLFNIYVLNVVDFLGIFKHTQVMDDKCILKKGVSGGEDLVRWSSKAVLTGSTNRRNWFMSRPNHITQGKIFVIHGFKEDLEADEVEKLPIYELPILSWPRGVSF